MLAAPVQAQASAGTSQAQGRDQARTPAFTLDTPIERLVADPRARAVLNRELPGLTTHDRYDQFKGMSLKALKPFSGGLITDARLEAVRRGLAEL
ncbi:MAG: hypothetical protein DI624_06475 [Brevundimonas sp.]|nr:MAG: hypothetical protein DI624_06475 [Brevundimonas sp.]